MSKQSTTTRTHTDPDGYVNGVHLETLKGTVSAIAAESALGQCKFRASNTWLGGAHNRTRITGFYGACQEIAHKQTYELHADEPPILAGNDVGANPVEHLLNALAACVTTSMVAHAAVRGIHIESLESELEGRVRVELVDLDVLSVFLPAVDELSGSLLADLSLSGTPASFLTTERSSMFSTVTL